MSDTQVADPNSWLAKFRKARPDLFPQDHTASLLQPLGRGVSVVPMSGVGQSANISPLSLGGVPQPMSPIGQGIPGPHRQPGYNPLTSLSPPPAPPDTSAQFDQLGQIRQGIAQNQVLAQEQEQMQNQARMAALQAQLSAMPQHEASNPAFNWQNITPQSLGAPQQVPVAQREAPRRDNQSSLIAALAGLFDPKGAGTYNAAPLEAGIGVANQQYQDKLQQNAILQQQYLQQYEAQRANAQQNNQFATLNQEQGQRSALAGLNDAQRLQEQAATLSGGVAGAQAQQSPLVDFVARTRQVTESGTKGQMLQDQIQRAYDTWKTQTQEWEKTLSPAARLQSMQEHMYGEALMNQLTNKTKSQISTANNTTKTDINAATNTTRTNIAAAHETAATARNTATNAQSNANNIRNNEGESITGPAAKDPEISRADKDYTMKYKHWDMLQRAYSRQAVPPPGAKFELDRAAADVHAADDNVKGLIKAWQAKQTPTPSGVGNGGNNGGGTTAGMPSPPPGFSGIRIR